MKMSKKIQAMLGAKGVIFAVGLSVLATAIAFLGPLQRTTDDLPAQVLDAQSSEVSVTVNAEQGALPEGTTLLLRDVEDDKTISTASSTVEEERQVAVKQVRAVDISFLNAAGEEIQPQKPVHVSVSSDGISSEGTYVVHMDREGNPEVVDQQNKFFETGSAVSFDSDTFSIYAIVVTEKLETDVITADGKTFQVLVSFDSDANIPAGAELKVDEIQEGSDSYEEARDNTIRALSDENGLAFVSQMRLFDISIVKDGEEIEPSAPVQVSVEYMDAVPAEEDSELTVVHFGEDETEVLDVTERDANAGEISSFQFETETFSTFAFVQANYIGSLNGQSFAIVRDNGSNKIAILADALDASKLKGTYVNVLSGGTLTSVTAANGKTESETAITVWTFEHVRDNLYYIKGNNGKYMNLTLSSLTLSDTPEPIEVYPTDSSGNLSGYIRLRCADDSRYVVSNRWGSADGGFQSANSTDNNTRFSLYASVDNTVFPEITAKKISAAELTNENSYVIYQNVYNSEIGEYENYVVAGDGSLVYAYDDGDYVGFRTDKSITWSFVVYTDQDGNPTGYYDFYNEDTGNYLAPQQGGTLAQKAPGVLLSGRDNGAYSTTIEGWDSNSWAYYGYGLDLTSRELVPETGSDSALFSFAALTDIERGTLHELQTVDSVSNGIKISMYDFSNRAMMNLFNNDTWYQNGQFKQGLLKRVLGDDGLPVSSTNKSFSQIYNSTNFKGNANHLFLQSVYDATGYYEYNAFNNFAHYDEKTGDFTVYEEMGIPQNGAGGSVSSYYRGNFLPYNNLDPAKKGTNTRLYDSLTGWTSLENPVFRDAMYLLKESTNYYFGTIIEADFLQARDGLDTNGAPVLYEFMGDDDLWVYIDGVLVLDIGGIHGSVSGSINFSTGEVDAGGVKTTIKQCFKDAGLFPDGTAWNDTLADNYFKGDTFTDYSGHTMKMFYQERGAGASTLKVRFNLPVIESGTFAVEKQLSGTEQQNYANVQFAYQAFVEDKNGNSVPLYPGMILSPEGTVVDPETVTDEQKEHAVKVTYEGSGDELTFSDNEKIGENLYHNVFYLKPGEACIFSGIPDGVRYYVQEIDVSGSYFETVMINEANMVSEDGTGEGGTIPEDSAITARSVSKTIRERQRVLFRNQCSPKNLRDLRITKQVVDPVEGDNTTFEFRVMLEGADGRLTYFSQGNYYLVKADQNGAEHYYQYIDGALTDRGTTPVVCSQSGQWGTIAGIPDGFTVIIRGLLADTDFKVEEVFGSSSGAGYQQAGKTMEEDSYASPDLENADGKIKLGKDAKVTILNQPAPKVSVLKISSESKKPLPGAEFAIYTTYTKLDADDNVIARDASGTELSGLTTGDNGTLSTVALTSGTYYLVETKAPMGYMLLTSPVVITVDGKNVKAGQEVDAETLTADENNVYTITVENESTYELPYSGGTGTKLFTVIGIAIMALAALLLWRHKKR